MYSIRILTLKLKFNDVDDLDENWPANLQCQRAKAGASRFCRLLAVNKRTFRKTRTYGRTDVLAAFVRPVRTDVQTYRRTDVQTYRRTDVQTYWLLGDVNDTVQLR